MNLDPWSDHKPPARPPVKAPADLNWDAIEAKIAQRKQANSGTGEPKYDSGRYLSQLREEDPWPTQDEKNSNSVSLVNCRFLTPAEDLLPDEPCTVGCDVKVLQPPSSRKVLFRLQHRLADSDPWTDSNETSEAGLKPEVPQQTIQANLTLHCPMPAPDLGTLLHYRVVAEHPEAASNAEGPDTPVQLRNLCHYMGAPEITFRNDSSCPTLDESGGLIQALAAAVDRLSVPQSMGSQTVVVFGFASSSGDADHDRELSVRRARSLKVLLDRDAQAWGSLADDFGTGDIQQILSGLTKAFGWPCDPGQVDGKDGTKTRAALKSFQGECNRRLGLGLKEDGICGPKTWKAVHRVLCGLVAQAMGQDPSSDPSWPKVPWGYPEGGGVYGCGKDFAASDDQAADRHAEICFFESNMEPALRGLSSSDIPTKGDGTSPDNQA
jgi:peptidoglycan hydrolase-like protein with peptidoglycan-binding domain